MVCTQCKYNFCFGCLKARASHSAIQEHMDCARLSSEFESRAEQQLRAWKRAAKDELRRQRAAEITARQMELLGTRDVRHDIEVIVNDSFFELDFGAQPQPPIIAATATTATTATTTNSDAAVETTTILRKLSSNASKRRLLALSF